MSAFLQPLDYLLGIHAVHALMGFGNATIIAEAVLAAKAAARAADSASQAGAARQPQPDGARADRFSVVANDRQCGRADAGGHMHRARVHAHHSSGPTAGTRQLNQVGAPAQIDKGAG